MGIVDHARLQGIQGIPHPSLLLLEIHACCIHILLAASKEGEVFRPRVLSYGICWELTTVGNGHTGSPDLLSALGTRGLPIS